MNEILKAERLTKTYVKSIAVSEVSLTVRQGDIWPYWKKWSREDYIYAYGTGIGFTE